MGKSQRDYVHDIRNSLAGISGFAGLLEQDLKDNPELQNKAKRIVKGINNLNELLTAMMEDNKSEEGKP